MELLRKQGNEVQAAHTLLHLSSANGILGLYEEGIRQAKEASEIFGRINITSGQALAFNDLASLLLEHRQLDAAGDAVSRGIQLVPEKGHENTVSQLHRNLGRIYRSKGEKEKAVHHFQTALRIAIPLNANDLLFLIHSSLVELFRDEDKFEEANAHIQQAKSFVAHNAYKLSRGMMMQVDIWLRQGRFEEAKLEALHALEAYEKLGAAKDAEACRDLIQKIEQAMENRTTQS